MLYNVKKPSKDTTNKLQGVKFAKFLNEAENLLNENNRCKKSKDGNEQKASVNSVNFSKDLFSKINHLNKLDSIDRALINKESVKQDDRRKSHWNYFIDLFLKKIRLVFGKENQSGLSREENGIINIKYEFQEFHLTFCFDVKISSVKLILSIKKGRKILEKDQLKIINYAKKCFNHNLYTQVIYL